MATSNKRLNPNDFPMRMEDIEEVNIYIPPQYRSVKKRILKVLVNRRGATTDQVLCDVFGEEATVKNVEVHLSNMKKEGLVWSEQLSCHCCRKINTYYYTTDEGKRALA